MNRSVRLLALVAVAGSLGAAAAEAVEPCPSPQDVLCRAAERDAGRGVVKLITSVPPAREAAPLSLLAVIPSPPPRTLGAKLWDLVKRGVRVDGTVVPKFDDGPPLPGKRGFALAMVGVKIRFGETLETELWGDVVGIELLDHSLSLDGTFRPFE